MQRLAPVLLFVLMFVVAGLLQAAPPPDLGKMNTDEMKVIEIQVNAMKAGNTIGGPAPGGPEDKSALWWNDPGIVKALTLSDKQRTKMEKYLKFYRESVPPAQRPDAFHEALVQGEWKNAQAEGGKVAKAASASVQLRATLKIDVLAVLSKEQLQKLVDQQPRLIYKPWKRAMSPQ